ncbi:hypothetical protein COOONC_28191, partial [Cooperia oncophora]
MTTTQSFIAEHSLFEQKPPLVEKILCYAVIAIKSIAAKDKLANYLMNNGFDDMLFVEDLRDHPIVKSAFPEITSEQLQLHEQQSTSQDPAAFNSSDDVLERPYIKEEHEDCEEISAVQLIGDLFANSTTPSTSYSDNAPGATEAGSDEVADQRMDVVESLLNAKCDCARDHSDAARPELEEVSGPKNNTRRRCTGCYSTTSKEQGRVV